MSGNTPYSNQYGSLSPDRISIPSRSQSPSANQYGSLSPNRISIPSRSQSPSGNRYGSPSPDGISIPSRSQSRFGNRHGSLSPDRINIPSRSQSPFGNQYGSRSPDRISTPSRFQSPFGNQYGSLSPDGIRIPSRSQSPPGNQYGSLSPGRMSTRLRSRSSSGSSAVRRGPGSLNWEDPPAHLSDEGESICPTNIDWDDFAQNYGRFGDNTPAQHEPTPFQEPQFAQYRYGNREATGRTRSPSPATRSPPPPPPPATDFDWDSYAQNYERFGDDEPVRYEPHPGFRSSPVQKRRRTEGLRVNRYSNSSGSPNGFEENQLGFEQLTKQFSRIDDTLFKKPTRRRKLSTPRRTPKPREDDDYHYEDELRDLGYDPLPVRSTDSRQNPRNENFPPLPDNAEDQLEVLYSNEHSLEPIMIIDNIQITGQDIFSLRHSMLVDTVLDGYLALVKRRIDMEGANNIMMVKTSINWFMISFEDPMAFLDTVGNIFEVDKLYIPYNIPQSFHWLLIVVDWKHRTIRGYDSFNDDCSGAIQAVFNFLVTTHNMLVEMGFITSLGDIGNDQWDMISVRGLPKQGNGTDCGVFVCQFANFLCGLAGDGSPLGSYFNQEDMRYLRQRMALQLINQRVEMP